MFEFTVAAADEGERLDIWLARQGLPFSRSQIRRRIEEGEVLVGGQPAKPARKNGTSNGHVLPLRARDLCTTNAAARNGAGRKNYIDATVSDTNWIRVQWDLTRDSIHRAESRLGSDWHTAVPTLRLLGVAALQILFPHLQVFQRSLFGCLFSLIRHRKIPPAGAFSPPVKEPRLFRRRGNSR